MDPISRLIDARQIIFQALQKEIINIELDTSIYQLKILFSQGSIDLFLRILVLTPLNSIVLL